MSTVQPRCVQIGERARYWPDTDTTKIVPGCPLGWTLIAPSGLDSSEYDFSDTRTRPSGAGTVCATCEAHPVSASAMAPAHVVTNSRRSSGSFCKIGSSVLIVIRRNPEAQHAAPV